MMFCGESPTIKKGVLFWSTRYRWFALGRSGNATVGSRGSVGSFPASTRLPQVHNPETNSNPRIPRITPPSHCADGVQVPSKAPKVYKLRPEPRETLR
jgi:hypothetical protein